MINVLQPRLQWMTRCHWRVCIIFALGSHLWLHQWTQVKEAPDRLMWESICFYWSSWIISLLSCLIFKKTSYLISYQSLCIYTRLEMNGLKCQARSESYHEGRTVKAVIKSITILARRKRKKEKNIFKTQTSWKMTAFCKEVTVFSRVAKNKFHFYGLFALT